MKATPSSKGRILPSVRRTAAYRLELHPVSHLPRMVAVSRPKRKVTAAKIARLPLELV